MKLRCCRCGLERKCVMKNFQMNEEKCHKKHKMKSAIKIYATKYFSQTIYIILLRRSGRRQKYLRRNVTVKLLNIETFFTCEICSRQIFQREQIEGKFMRVENHWVELKRLAISNTFICTRHSRNSRRRWFHCCKKRTRKRLNVM